jgi:DNA-3-methyladenine glycosylase II
VPPQLPASTEARAKRALARGIGALADKDPDVAQWVAKIGLPLPRIRPRGFEGFLRAIVAQQVSVAAASGIWRRLEEGLGAIEPEAVLARDDAALRALGLSRQKAGYARGLAAAIADGTLDFEALHRAEDEDAIASITRLKGLGRWSAEIYLLFALQRPDVWPANDLALQEAMRILKNLRRRPDEKRLRRIGEAWRPHRSAGALFLWHVYHHAKGR